MEIETRDIRGTRRVISYWMQSDLVLGQTANQGTFFSAPYKHLSALDSQGRNGVLARALLCHSDPYIPSLPSAILRTPRRDQRAWASRTERHKG